MIWVGFSVMWASAATTASLGFYFTGSPWCVAALIFPLCVNFTYTREKGKAK